MVLYRYRSLLDGRVICAGTSLCGLGIVDCHDGGGLLAEIFQIRKGPVAAGSYLQSF